ncbi:MAG: C4-dicarboxylate ABC transporter, partial [Acinetobacter sp.]
ALLLQHLTAGMQSVYILLSCYVLWGISVLPAFAVLTILMLRLALHQLPSKDMAISSWLALGPIGTGALALLLLGAEAPRILAHSAWGATGIFLQQAGFLAALMLIGFGLWWLGIAVLTSLKHAAADLPFNLGWWGLTFPLGVFTLAVLNLAAQTQLPAVYGCAYTLAAVLALLWGIVLSKTLKGFYQGQLIFSPCLKAYLEQRAD